MPELFENFQRIDIQATRKQAMAEGRAEGRAQGRAEGRAEGLTTGRAQGRLEVLIELILPLIEKGCSITEFTPYLNIPISEIEMIYDAVNKCGDQRDIAEIMKYCSTPSQP
ncbi:MAG: hypothetical protein E7293_06625 [Lachnospiraceae bacterium]|nr:hypothetical protein [Lachnospiraceae bacterium]